MLTCSKAALKRRTPRRERLRRSGRLAAITNYRQALECAGSPALWRGDSCTLKAQAVTAICVHLRFALWALRADGARMERWLGARGRSRYTCSVRVADFHYELPPDRIAQAPTRERDDSRLLVLHRPTALVEHRGFRDLPGYLRRGDVLVLNDSRVIRARLRGVKTHGGGRVEILLAEEATLNHWWVMLRPGKRVRAGTGVDILDSKGGRTGITMVLEEKADDGLCRVRFAGTANILSALVALGEVPLPPYIVRESPATDAEDAARYQTVFAVAPGSVAAPTAGLHFTDTLLAQLRHRGVEVVCVTLHVGLGTFAPVKAGQVEQHVMHEERFEVEPATAQAVNRAKTEGRRVIAVGTTTARVLEHLASLHEGRLAPGRGKTRLFIHPPATFRVVDALVTNFHLPESTLLMLVSAFASPGETRGRELILKTYATAIREGYRFFSYGDAMLIL